MHLWFLPFAFIISLLIVQLFAPVRLNNPAFCFLSISIIPLCLACFYSVELKLFGIPWEQWVSVLPAAAVGVLLAAAQGERNRTAGLVFVIFIAFIVGELAQLQSLSIEFSIGTFFAIFGIVLKCKSTSFTFWLGSISLGVYLAHPLCAAALEHVFNLQNIWTELVSTIILSIILAETYRRLEIFWRALPRLSTVKQ